MNEPAEQDPPPEQKESPIAFARRSLPANLLAAAVCGVLTLWQTHWIFCLRRTEAAPC